MTKLNSDLDNRKLAVVVLAAGRSTRMQSQLPKVLHPLAGHPILDHVITNVMPLTPERVIVIVGPQTQSYIETNNELEFIVQPEALGTADAVERAANALSNFVGDVLIVYGDSPLLSAETMKSMLVLRRSKDRFGVVVLGFEPQTPGNYGRLVLDSNDELSEIIEASEASEEQLTINLCNSGMMVVDGGELFNLLAEIKSNNSKNERYLTDIVKIARNNDLLCSFVLGKEIELMGIDTRSDLAFAESLLQKQMRNKIMQGGATLIDPKSVFFSSDTSVGRDVVIEPNVFFGPRVTIGDGTRIRAYSHIEGAQIGTGVTIGPFARIRPGTQLEAGSSIGNFVETKNATLGKGAKANHLSYLGDSDIGSRANIGAGTITCNYDGFTKSKTVIGEDAFIGSNTALIAPVSIGSGAVVGAGSAIKSDVADNSLALTRPDQSELPGWAAKRRSKQKKKKD